MLITPVFAESTTTDIALDFLRSKQDSTGRINTGFSAPSQWSSIAFASQNINISDVKNPDVSLLDFLKTDIPIDPSAATDWETKILAIVAIGSNPSNFNGENFIKNLEDFHTDGQIGDICSLNDDIFGLLALTASGKLADNKIKQDALNFIIDNQDETNGGFGFSAPGCEWYNTSTDMTAAGLHALVSARDSGMEAAGFDDAIDQAKNYLFSNQNSDGGFGYSEKSDSDTTGWVIIGLNAAGLSSSTEAKNAKSWLLTQQSESDGGFTAFDWGTSEFVSNATTTSHAILAINGKTWISKIYQASTDDIIPTSTPSPTNMPTPSPTLTPTPTATPTTLSTTNSNTTNIYNYSSGLGQDTDNINKYLQNQTPKEQINQVLGEKTKNENHEEIKIENLNSGLRRIFAEIFFFLGIATLSFYIGGLNQKKKVSQKLL